MKQVAQGRWYTYIQAMLRYWLFLILVFSVTRLFFYYNNSASFKEVLATDFLAGTWFDMIMIALWFLPLWIIWLIPLPFKHHDGYVRLIKVVALICYISAMALNVIDIEYYRYITKRSTKELLSFFQTGNDFNQLAGSFATDFWWLILLFVVLVVLHEWVFKRWIRPLMFRQFRWQWQTVWLLILVPIIVVIGRGGFQLKPVSPLDAANYTSANNASLILNTPFVVLKSFGKESLEFKHYMDDTELNALYQPKRQSNPLHLLPDSTNVVILILEGFGIEFIGKYGFAHTSYTPFLDSLLEQSLYFEFAYANGRTSIESVPSILASMPSWMSTSYINSPYEDNAIVGLPNLLRTHGYSSAFFHGATNGSMRFDVFAKQLGFEQYFGRKEYNNEAHSDGTWGILDEYFNPWSAQQMSTLPEPFLATLFTLSSHHPYFVPTHYRENISSDAQPIAASIQYADYALQQFFETAQQQPWYNNTLFVICADHTPATSTDSFYNYNLVYRIPLAYYHPSGRIQGGKSTAITQQINIYPTLLDLLNIDTGYYSFGHSDVDTSSINYAFAYAEGTYLYFRDRYLYTYRQDDLMQIFNKEIYRELPVEWDQINNDSISEARRHIQSIIQRYNQDVKRNQTIWIPNNQ